MMTVVTPWQKRRDILNHDTIKNIYLNRIKAFIERLLSSHADTSRIFEFLNEDLPKWGEYGKEAELLLENFVEEMSPKVLFQYPPLNRCDKETKEWLGFTLHHLWLTRYPVKATLEACQNALLKANEEYKKVCSGLKRDGSPTTTLNLVELLPLFETFRDACSDFSNKFGMLPREILVV